MLLQFDKAINQALATRVKSRLTFKVSIYLIVFKQASALVPFIQKVTKINLLQAGKLNTYRFCDNVWTFMLNDVEFREVQEVAIVDKVKIVACDGKSKY